MWSNIFAMLFTAIIAKGIPKDKKEIPPDYINIPGLYEVYGVMFDRNHMMPITTQFIME